MPFQGDESIFDVPGSTEDVLYAQFSDIFAQTIYHENVK